MFSELAVAHIHSRQHAGALADATHVGTAGSPGGGPYCVLYLYLEGDNVLKAGYDTHGCPTSVAAAGVLCSLIIGRKLEDCLSMTGDELARIIGPIPEGKDDCPKRTIVALNSLTRSPGEHIDA